MILTRTEAPATEPITLAEAKGHLGVTINDDDTFIGACIVAARHYCEHYTQRAIITQTWCLKFDRFPLSNLGSIELPRPPLASVTSITYVDVDGEAQTLSSDDYTVATDSSYGRAYLNYDGEWPDTQDYKRVVAVTFVAGYGSASAVPGDIKAAMLLLVGEMYANRENSTVGSIVSANKLTTDVLLEPYRDMRRL